MTAATSVYVSNSRDGDIRSYLMQPDGALQPGARVEVADAVGPMAVSPDRRFLYAATRSAPFSVHVHAIDPRTGALTRHSVSPLVDSFPYISLDRTGRYLFGCSYKAHLVSVNAVGADGNVAAEPLQVIPVGRNAHSIRVDDSNRFVYVPTLGSDQVFQFVFDARSGRLQSNTPAVARTEPGSGPRHFVTSADNRFLYVLGEMHGTVTTFALDADTGLLTEVGSVSALPPDTGLVPGTPRVAPDPPSRNREHDVWSADIHLTPDGAFLYVSERGDSTLGVLRVDRATGKLRYIGSTPTEAQPRGFAIDPTGRFIVACGERSDTVSVHAIDAISGMPGPARRYPGGGGANWVQFVALNTV